jgi:DNA-binding MarR family transcriptional regulator
VRRQPVRDRDHAHAGRVAAPALGGILEFMRLIWGVGHGLQATSKRMESELGVTGPQRLVVRIVGRCPGLTAGTLADVLRLHPSTLTGVLRRLEDRGVLERCPGERDRRQARLHLTPAGRAIDRRHAGTVEAAVRRGLSGVDAERIRAAAEVLHALETALSGQQRTTVTTQHRSTTGVR